MNKLAGRYGCEGHQPEQQQRPEKLHDIGPDTKNLQEFMRLQ